MASPPPGLWVAIALGGCGLAGAVALWLFCWICPAWRYREWRDARQSRIRVRRLSTELSQSQFVVHCATIATEAAPSFHSRVRALSQMYTRRSSGRLLRDGSARGRAASAPEAGAGAAAFAAASGPSAVAHDDDVGGAGDVSLEEVAREALALELSGARSPPRIGAGNVPVLHMPPTAPSPDWRRQRSSLGSSPLSAGRRSSFTNMMMRGMPRTPDPSDARASPGVAAAAAAASRPWRSKGFPAGNAPSPLSRSLSSPAHWQPGPPSAPASASASAAADGRGARLSPAALIRSRSTPRIAAIGTASSASAYAHPAAELEMSPLGRGNSRTADAVAVDVTAVRPQQAPDHLQQPLGAAVGLQSSVAPAELQAVAPSAAGEASSVPVTLQPLPLQRIRQPGILVRIVEPDLPDGGLGLRRASNSPRLGLNRATSQQQLLQGGAAGAPHAAQAAVGEAVAAAAVAGTPNTALAELEELESMEAAAAASSAGTSGRAGAGKGAGRSRQPGQRTASGAELEAAATAAVAESTLPGPAAGAAAAPHTGPQSGGMQPVGQAQGQGQGQAQGQGQGQGHFRSFTTGSMMALAPRSASGSAPVVAVRVAAEQERRLSSRHAEAAAAARQQRQRQLRAPPHQETEGP